ncbi:Zinc finger protein [Natranaeroarchaeum sulfidigenes]|uniref:Zinc finger protein n=1 Tax=Natranaeroarchaeum sulfidigenes TaxID=2784880 RepID=A0A897MWC1_9EURY|nr:Zinc finger protein [Natranaeroarchaeum sulfidigenes]
MCPMPTCDHCNAHVSERFERVFADEYGRIFACPSCSANAGIAEAARLRAQQA